MQFVKAIQTLAFGSLGAGVINFSSISITARLLEPEHFGSYAIFASLVTIVSVFSTLRADVFICQRRSLKRAELFFKISLFFVIIFTLLSFVLLTLYGKYIFDDKNSSVFTYFLLSISILMLGSFQASLSASLHRKDYKLIAKVRFFQAFIGGVIQVSVAIFSNNSMLALILGFLVNQGVGGIFLVPMTYFRITRKKIAECKWLLLNYRKKLVSSSLSCFLLILSPMLPVIFISNNLGTLEAGFFYFAIQITTIPFTFVRRILANIAMAEVSTISSLSFPSYYNRYKLYISLFFVTSFFLYFLYFSYSDELFLLVFGEEWSKSGKLSAILIPMFFVDMISYACFQILNLKNKTNWLLNLELFRFLTVVVGVWFVSYLDFSLFVVTTWYSFWMLISYFIICFLAVLVVNKGK